MIDDLHQFVEVARAIQFDIDQLTKPARRSPRKLRGGPIVKLRITADSEAEAEQARQLIEQLLASLNCRMQRPRAGSNPKYADAQKWISYGDIELPASKRKRKR